MDDPTKTHKFFYGYWIVAVTFLCMFIESGAVFYAFSIFFKPLQAEFGWSRGGIAAGFTIFAAIRALTSPFIGGIVDRYGARKTIPLGAAVTGIGLVWLSFIQNLWSFYIGYVVLALGTTAMSSIPVTHVVSNWFTKRRGFAIGIMSTGVGVGGLVLAPLIGAYLIPSFGWRTSYFAMALLTWVLIIPTASLVLKSKPADIGLYPDGLSSAEAVAEAELLPPVSEGWTLSTALKTLTFWLIAAAFFSMNFSQAGTLQHQMNHLTDIGIPVATAATAVGAVGFGSAVGKFFFGWLCDKIQAKYAATISFTIQLAAIAVLVTLKETSPAAMIWLYVALFGFGMGGWMPTMAMLISSNFGLDSYGAIFGMLTLAHLLSAAIGPLVAGYLFDATQTYVGVFIIFLVLYAVSIPLMLAVRRPKSRLASFG